MSKIQSVRDLRVWKKGMELAVSSYDVTQRFPADEKFGITAQIRRAATSVPANIAEGFGRWNQKEFARFLGIASGSLAELETHFLVAKELGYVDAETARGVLGDITEASKMIFGLMSKIRRSEDSKTRGLDDSRVRKGTASMLRGSRSMERVKEPRQVVTGAGSSARVV